jgi:1-acyl-sn-glycerol-3-phosphate acyltransferase
VPDGWLASLVRTAGRRYVRWRLRRDLSTFAVAGLRPGRDAPAVWVANHVAWWDGLVVVHLAERVGGTTAIAMDAAGLARFPFFSWFGAFALDRGGPLQAIAGVRAAAARAQRGPVWWFAQGLQRPAHLRPLGLKGGFGVVARRAQVPVVPVALAYVFGEDPRPGVWVHVGEPLPPHATLDAVAAAIEDGLRQIDDATDPARVDDGARAAFLPLWSSPAKPPVGAGALSRLWRAFGGSDA